MLRWRASDLAEKAGVSLSTILRAEGASGPVPMVPATARAVEAALTAAGIVFQEGPDGISVTLKAPAG